MTDPEIIYGIEKSSGSYDDYREDILAVTFDKEKAEAEVARLTAARDAFLPLDAEYRKAVTDFHERDSSRDLYNAHALLPNGKTPFLEWHERFCTYFEAWAAERGYKHSDFSGSLHHKDDGYEVIEIPFLP